MADDLTKGDIVFLWVFGALVLFWFAGCIGWVNRFDIIGGTTSEYTVTIVREGMEFTECDSFEVKDGVAVLVRCKRDGEEFERLDLPYGPSCIEIRPALESTVVQLGTCP